MHTQRSAAPRPPSTLTGWQTPESIDEAHAAVNDAVHDLNRAWREHAMMLAVDRDAARQRADRLAQLIQPAAHIAAAYLDQHRTPDLRDEAVALLEEIRRLGR